MKYKFLLASLVLVFQVAFVAGMDTFEESAEDCVSITDSNEDEVFFDPIEKGSEQVGLSRESCLFQSLSGIVGAGVSLEFLRWLSKQSWVRWILQAIERGAIKAGTEKTSTFFLSAGVVIVVMGSGCCCMEIGDRLRRKIVLAYRDWSSERGGRIKHE